MTTQYWLVKTEPEAYSWEDFLRDGQTNWDGVRNYQARNYLKAMRPGDAVLFYASVTTKAVVGTARVIAAAFPDPTAKEGEWVAVKLEVGDTLATPVTLAEIKRQPALMDTPLIKQSRLSVMPLSKAEFTHIVNLGRA